jgi:broad specificity phosphatase PhoE
MMMRIFLLRHAPTSWNETRRIQGHTDIAITEASRTALAQIKIPAQWKQIKWFSSPLGRAVETARLLGANEIETRPELIEMKWGAFEGLTLPRINQEIIHRCLQPSTGLDFQPPGGECPRAVCQRIKIWFQIQSRNHLQVMAVTHKGVIRAALSLATGWDMEQVFDHDIQWDLPLAFDCSPEGRIALVKVNCQWEDTSLLV